MFIPADIAKLIVEQLKKKIDFTTAINLARTGRFWRRAVQGNWRVREWLPKYIESKFTIVNNSYEHVIVQLLIKHGVEWPTNIVAELYISYPKIITMLPPIHEHILHHLYNAKAIDYKELQASYKKVCPGLQVYALTEMLIRMYGRDTVKENGWYIAKQIKDPKKDAGCIIN